MRQRALNKLTHGAYDIKSDFDFTYGWSIDPDVQVRSQDYVSHALKYWNNAAQDLFVTLTKTKR